MYRLSLIISEIYNKYLPLAEKDGIILNLDFSDTTKEISDPDRVKQFLDEHLASTLKRSDKGEITIGVDKEAITITDSATTLSHAACALLSNRFIDVTSRVGFGTTIRIFLRPREVSVEPIEDKPKLEIEGAAFTVAADKSSGAPTIESEVRVKAKDQKAPKRKINLGAHLQLNGKSNTEAKQGNKMNKKTIAKTVTKTKRELSAAAKKADKEVKRIAKKAEKQAKKLDKETKKVAKTTGRKISKTADKAKKTTKKTVRKLKLS